MQPNKSLPIAIAAVVFLLTACGETTRTWVKPGGTEQTRREAMSLCYQQSTLTLYAPGSTRARPQTDERMYRTCMHGQGWEFADKDKYGPAKAAPVPNKAGEPAKLSEPQADKK
jgi:hypothetical protein